MLHIHAAVHMYMYAMQVLTLEDTDRETHNRNCDGTVLGVIYKSSLR